MIWKYKGEIEMWVKSFFMDWEAWDRSTLVIGQFLYRGQRGEFSNAAVNHTKSRSAKQDKNVSIEIAKTKNKK